jgi:hypothetical protein
MFVKQIKRRFHYVQFNHNLCLQIFLGENLQKNNPKMFFKPIVKNIFRVKNDDSQLSVVKGLRFVMEGKFTELTTPIMV